MRVQGFVLLRGIGGVLGLVSLFSGFARSLAMLGVISI